MGWGLGGGAWGHKGSARCRCDKRMTRKSSGGSSLAWKIKTRSPACVKRTRNLMRNLWEKVSFLEAEMRLEHHTLVQERGFAL